jgi:uridine phosphorylase
MDLGPSELILNQDGSVYHLNLLPGDIAEQVILVGDPQRVERVSRHFDTLEIQKHKREFITHTGRYRNKRITVLSTGIGTDNIDIVLNELDALVNIDLKDRKVLNKKSVINLIRIGTSGALQSGIPVNSFLLSEYAMGFDSVLHYYQGEAVRHEAFEKAFVEQVGWDVQKSRPYVVKGDEKLRNHFLEPSIHPGLTGSNVGFYGPQGRHLRLPPSDPRMHEKLMSFSHEGFRLTNFEMETSAIYGLSALMGHRALSMNAIIANRADNTFSKNPGETVDRLILWTLEKICAL